ncbi:MAG: septum formation protein Maf [Ignavibacteriae bacterium]|nr:MAG: septum formation protein Maf [Ignavibacteriota bacterium]
MLNSRYPIYLASKSPRRREMLKIMGITHKTLSISTEEKIYAKKTPLYNVKRIADDKCEAALKKVKEGIIITADTIVVIENKIIGKPKDRDDAKRILKLLSNNIHFVYTAFCVCNKTKNIKITGYEKTKVFFRKLEEKEIEEYILTGSPFDKAGAYGIQDDYGAVFVKKIIGCYYNVLGFPASKIYDALKKVI